jgi:hypothetical protein
VFNPQGEQSGRFIPTPFGWGTRVTFEGVGAAVSWFHLPISTVNVRVDPFERFELRRVFLLFECPNASVNNVHVYDGSQKIQEYNELGLTGNYYLVKRPRNTFELNKPHQVKAGIGLSFYCIFAAGRDPGELTVVAAGAEFETRNVFLPTMIGRLLNRLLGK